jgi:hypothetical protein
MEIDNSGVTKRNAKVGVGGERKRGDNVFLNAKR